jgi:hypothetical protein
MRWAGNVAGMVRKIDACKVFGNDGDLKDLGLDGRIILK